MLRNDEEYKEYLEDIEPYHGDPVGERSTLRYREIMLGTWPLLEEEETISVLDSTRGKQGEPSFPHVWKADQRVVL
ncbi:CNB_1a_G0057790.mRNA.1.CDS.1 [Saccharomyces cerevisiae]|nr:CNB_1a_G0057790.mRNA.1.CDS.1 [Saccharomyces cerevisiae]CAI7491211.1 CNB_1a_G0057790.mRNA.1.CDS.1 [Saccharomyces cerevisiae]